MNQRIIKYWGALVSVKGVETYGQSKMGETVNSKKGSRMRTRRSGPREL